MYDEPTRKPVQDGGHTRGAPPSGRAIFRAEARQHFAERQDRVVLPRLISGPVFTFLWVAAVLLMAIGAFIVFWPLLGQL